MRKRPFLVYRLMSLISSISAPHPFHLSIPPQPPTFPLPNLLIKRKRPLLITYFITLLPLVLPLLLLLPSTSDTPSPTCPSPRRRHSTSRILYLYTPVWVKLILLPQPAKIRNGGEGGLSYSLGLATCAIPLTPFFLISFLTSPAPSAFGSSTSPSLPSTLLLL